MNVLLIDPFWLSDFYEKVNSSKLSEDTLRELATKISIRNNQQKELYRVDGKTAIIPVFGPLTKKPDFFYSIFGGENTSYDDIIAGVEKADAEKNIEKTKLLFNTPGGEWIGLTETINALASAKKPIIAEIIGMAASAGYGLASQADRIISTNDSNEIGSLGVMTRAFDNKGMIKTIRSSNAKNKNPDAFTNEGEKEIQRMLDDVELKFLQKISDGRSAATGKIINLKKVISDYGQGSIFLADEALERGMIDEIIPESQRISNSGNLFNPELHDGSTDIKLTVIPFDNVSGFIDKTWDKTSAEKRVRQHTGSQDGPNNSGSTDKQYKNYFSWFDNKNSENFAAYKLPIADVEGGKKVINIRAVRNALARLPQTAGIPAAEKERVKSTLQRYLDKFNKQKKSEANAMNKDEIKDQFPEAYAEIVDEGRELERKQAIGHIKMAKSTGAIEYGLECIKEGKSLMDQEVLAEYMSVSLKNNDLKNRGKDNPDENLNLQKDQEKKDQEKKDEEQFLSQVMEKSKLSAKAINKKEV